MERAVATLGSWRVRIDPTQVAWDFSVKASVTPTVGGRVVQVYGVRLGTMRVTGTVGKAGWREANRLLAQIKAWGDAQSKALHPAPLRFRYPPKRWDFAVFVTAMHAPDAPDGSAVLHANAVIAPKFTLELFIVEDNTKLATVAMDVWISRLAEGVGWKQTAYNGPLTQAQVDDLLQRAGYAGDLDGYLKARLKERITNPTVARR